MLLRGFVVEPPEMRFKPDGTAVTRVCILIDEKEQPVIFNGELAEEVNRTIGYGITVDVTGEPAIRRWKNRIGEWKQTTEFVGSKIDVIS